MLKVFQATFTNWSAHKASRLGAALAYYSIFSLGPLIVIVVAIAGLVFGQDAARSDISRTLQGILGSSGPRHRNHAGRCQPSE